MNCLTYWERRRHPGKMVMCEACPHFIPEGFGCTLPGTNRLGIIHGRCKLAPADRVPPITEMRDGKEFCGAWPPLREAADPDQLELTPA